MTDEAPRFYHAHTVYGMLPLSRSGLRYHMEEGGALTGTWAEMGMDLAQHVPMGGEGSGRGGGRMFSAEAVVAMVLSSELIRWGIRPADAFKIGLHFVFSFAVPDGQPARAPLYAEGETLLIVTTRTPCEADMTAPGADGFAIVSDTATSSLREEALKARGDEAQPVLLLNLSSMCARIAARLGEPVDTFLRPAAQVAA